MLNSEIEHGPGPVAAALRLALSMVSGERRELVRQAEKLTDAAAILDFLEAHPDVMLATILEERARSCEADMVARLLPRLPANPPEHVAEFAALFLARAREDYTTQVLHVAKRVRDAYPLGLLCLLLGVIDRGEFGLQFVWNVYRHLNREFGSPLDQAPLFGLVRYANRRKEAKAVPKEGTHPSH
ncbi:MAG: hypothetical protein A3K19_20745 [Lentisphaerae bacterium RIFOXYB12_FULL_65_16]|nr:MAG: hypothetical protein A3K18_19170 [Lentisphaerae bacterium RIFOXYA12_64_32]OGV85215.1 MAG: hypothetical protein A3K19_20745 [Lentisphaerae bacterium RIFOXYB12_FULL_65_16]